MTPTEWATAALAAMKLGPHPSSKGYADLHQHIAEAVRAASEEAADLARRKTDGLMKELRHLFALPNWHNRCGPWKDVNDALRRLHEATLRQDQ